MAKYVVARADDVKPGDRLVVEVEGRSVGIFNIDGGYFAVLNQCPHAGAPLCSHGTLFGIAEAATPMEEVRYRRRGEFILCPWHRWEYDLKTGESWFDPRNSRVRTYPVEVVEGSPEDLADASSERQRGPYVLEGYEVWVDSEQMLVVDTSRRRPAVRTQDLVKAGQDERGNP